MPLSTELANAVSMRLAGQGEACAEMTAVAPLLEVQAKWSRVPGDAFLLAEFARSSEGEHGFMYPLAGKLVHEGLAALMAYRMARVCGETIHTTANDYGFSLTARRGLVWSEERIREALSPQNLLDDLVACMNTAELARRQFREVARVAGLILQSAPGAAARGQRELMASATLLYEVLERYDPGSLLLEQARREILERQLEIVRLGDTLDRLACRPLVMVETERLTPMAFPLWVDRVTALLPAAHGVDRVVEMLEELQRATR